LVDPSTANSVGTLVEAKSLNEWRAAAAAIDIVIEKNGFEIDQMVVGAPSSRVVSPQGWQRV